MSLLRRFARTLLDVLEPSVSVDPELETGGIDPLDPLSVPLDDLPPAPPSAPLDELPPAPPSAPLDELPVTLDVPIAEVPIAPSAAVAVPVDVVDPAIDRPLHVDIVVPFVGEATITIGSSPETATPNNLLTFPTPSMARKPEAETEGPDFLDEMIAEREAVSPGFVDQVDEAFARRRHTATASQKAAACLNRAHERLDSVVDDLNEISLDLEEDDLELDASLRELQTKVLLALQDLADARALRLSEARSTFFESLHGEEAAETEAGPVAEAAPSSTPAEAAPSSTPVPAPPPADPRAPRPRRPRPPKPPVACAVPGCPDMAKSKALCGAHYMQWRRGGIEHPTGLLRDLPEPG